MFLFNRQNRKKIKLTDEDKKLVLERYSDIEWRDDVTRMRCVSCQNVAIISYTFNCRHLICRSCYDKNPKPCPRCLRTFTKLNASDVETESNLCQLTVNCPNKKYGCQQVGQLGIIVDHVRDCLHIRASLPIEYKGPTTVEALYRYVSEQLRTMSDEMRVMKSENEANWKQMQARMNEMQFITADQLNSGLDGIKANLDGQTGGLTNYEMQHKDGYVETTQQQMHDQMNVMEYKVDQSTRDLNGLTTDLQAHKENPTRKMHKEKDPGRKKTQNLRDEVEKLKSEHTRLAARAKDDMETIYTVKGRADTFIQLLEQKNRKMKRKLNKHENNIKNMMVVQKEQLEDMKSRIALMDDELKTNQTAMGLLESGISELSKDNPKQHEHGKDERNGEVEQVTTIRHQIFQNKVDLLQKQLEEVKTQTYIDNDELRLDIVNQMTTFKNQLAAVDSRVTTKSNKWEDIDNRMTTICNELATIDHRVAINDERMTTTINSLTTINNDVDAIANLIEDTNDRVDANNNRIKSTNKQVNSSHSRITATIQQLDVSNNRITATDNKLTTVITKLTLMEVWLCNYTGRKSPSKYNQIIKAAQKRVKNIGDFGTLGHRDGRRVSEFTWMVENIEEEMAKAKDVKYCIESKPFYINVPGYKVVLRLFPNDRQSNHVGVYLGLVEGEFDDIVSWPFNCEYELYSVSRDGTRFASISVNPITETSGRDSFNRPTNHALGYGDTEFIKSETLLANKDRYLTDGVLSIKATFWLSN